jgi:hypothetical protein
MGNMRMQDHQPGACIEYLGELALRIEIPITPVKDLDCSITTTWFEA